jgi:phage gp46-like protein
MSIKDLKLDKNSDGIFDISFENGDFALTGGLETSFMMTIYCQKREDSIEDPRSRGGWIGNELNEDGFEQGSLVWTLYQEKLDDDTVNICQNYLEDAFQWYIDKGIAKEIDIVVEKDVDLQKLNAKITAIRNDNTEFVQSYDLWINTINAS